MNASLGANRQRWKSSLFSNFIGDELVDRHVPVRAMLRLVMQDTGQEGVNRKVPTTDPVVETAVNRDLIPHVLGRDREEPADPRSRLDGDPRGCRRR